MVFRAQSPKEDNSVLLSKEDVHTTLRGQGMTGGKVGRSPEHKN